MAWKNKYGLIGKKLSHSFSKEYFSKKFYHEKLSDYSYELWELESIKNIRGFLVEKNVKGFNVTIPYKIEILEHLDILSDEVLEIGACNCVKIKNNVWKGYNTDWWGFLKMIENKLEPHHTSAIILGTGGAAKAVAFSLKKLDIPFIYVSRDTKRELNATCINYNDITPDHFKKYPVIINTTPLGMFPDIQSMPNVPVHHICEKNFVIDLIYNPPKTKLLQEAEKRGAKTLNGIEMLHLQAEKSWYIWQEINN